MFDTNIRFQTAAVCVLLIIVIDYLKNSHLKLLSTKCFRILLFLTGLNLALDITTVYTITHLDTVEPWVNKLCHQLFIGSVILAIFFNYMYVILLANDQKRMKKKELWLVLLPLLVSLAVIAIGRIDYSVTPEGVYSYGPMVYTVYICGIVYLVLTFKATMDKESSLTKEQRWSVRIGLLIWTLILAVQNANPQLLLSGMGFVLLVLAVYFSFENQKENYDTATDCFNANAFSRMLSEYYEHGKSLYLVNLTCENLERINGLLGHQMGIQALDYLREVLERNTCEPVFHSRDKVFSIFVTGKIEKMQEALERVVEELEESAFSHVKLNYHICIMDVRKYTKTQDEVYALMDFMEERCNAESERIYFLDETIVERKIRYDKIDRLLNEAMEEDGFEMYYQPIYSTSDGKFRSAEALIRLKNTGDLGFVSPEEFIPIAEEKGMIMEIGDRVLELVAGFIKRADLLNSDLNYIEVNLSGIQVAAPGLDRRLLQIMERNKVPASFINLEITETATINSSKSFLKNIESLKRDNFSFSMDDFGTGYSNLAQMNQLKYDLVKLDKSLIWPAFEEQNESAERLLASVIHMLKTICVRIVAEGVETEDMVNYLSQNGVEYLQGYYYSKPVTEEQFLEKLRQGTGGKN